MGRTTLIVLGIVAAIIAGGSYLYLQHVKQDDPVNNVDRTTGVWYPPYASRGDYDERKANYSADVRRAFQENPSLGNDVCYELRHSTVAEESVPPAARQLRAFLAANCMLLPKEQALAAAKAAKADAIEGSLDDIMTSAFAGVGSLSEAQRVAKERQLVEDLDAYDDVQQAIGAGTQAIALRPQDDRGAFLLLQAAGRPWNHTSYKPEIVRAFLDRLYRERSAGGDAHWLSGYQGFLLLTGRIDDARALTAKLPAQKDAWDATAAALVERLSGHREPFDALTKNCPSAEDGEGMSYCWFVTFNIIERMMRVQKESTPKVVKEVAFEAMRANPDNWPLRMTLLRDVQEVDAPAAKSEYARILQHPKEAPSGAILDTVYGLSKIALKDNDKENAVALTDCWLQLNGVTPAAVTADVWGKVGALPSIGPANPKEADVPCFADALIDPHRASDCATRAFSRRLAAALEAKDFALARQTVEQLAAYSLSHHVTADATRGALVNLAWAAHDEGRKADAQQIAAYLKAHPHGAYVEQAISTFGTAPASNEPWHSPTVVRSPASSCPPEK